MNKPSTRVVVTALLTVAAFALPSLENQAHAMTPSGSALLLIAGEIEKDTMNELGKDVLRLLEEKMAADADFQCANGGKCQFGVDPRYNLALTELNGQLLTCAGVTVGTARAIVNFLNPTTIGQSTTGLKRAFCADEAWATFKEKVKGVPVCLSEANVADQQLLQSIALATENGRQCNAGTTNWAISSQLSQCQECCDTNYPAAHLGAQNGACRAECGK